MYAGDTLLLSKELTDQKEGAHYLTRDISEKASMVPESQSWMPAFIKETASYVSSKASALRKFWGESHKDELFLDSRNLASTMLKTLKTI